MDHDHVLLGVLQREFKHVLASLKEHCQSWRVVVLPRVRLHTRLECCRVYLPIAHVVDPERISVLILQKLCHFVYVIAVSLLDRIVSRKTHG